MKHAIVVLAATVAILCGIAPVLTAREGGGLTASLQKGAPTLPASLTAHLEVRGFAGSKEIMLTNGGSHRGFIFSSESGACGILAVPLDPADEIFSLVRQRIPQRLISGALLWVGLQARPLPERAWEVHLRQMIARAFDGPEASRAVLLVPDGKCGGVLTALADRPS